MNISIVIPALNAAEYVPRLLEHIESQTMLPKEIIIVDSSADCKTELLVQNWQGAIPLIYHRVDFAYPGHARNIGVGLVHYEWIAFLDCQTIPDCDWLEKCSSVALRTGAELVTGLLIGEADTHFKQTLLAATSGKGFLRSLPGSLVLRHVFESYGGFHSDVRAGEDVEWINRLIKRGARCAGIDTPVLKYEGFPSSLCAAIGKWYVYSVSKAHIDVRNYQKLIYITIFMCALLILVRNWNSLFAHWQESSMYFIANVTKLFVASLFFLYIVSQGLIKPFNNKVKISFLLPWRWLEISFVRLCLDVAKAPGMILGALFMIRRKLVVLKARLCQK